MVEQHLLT